MQAQAQHVRTDMDQLVKLFAKSKYLAPHTPKLLRRRRQGKHAPAWHAAAPAT